MLGFLAGVPGQLATLAARLTAAWATKLDVIHAGLVAGSRMANLDNLNAGVATTGKSCSQIFSASGTFAVPPNVSAVFVLLVGGGGGGGGGAGSGLTGSWGANGGSSSFGSLLYAYPGNAGQGAQVGAGGGSGWGGGALGGGRNWWPGAVRK